MNKEKKHSRLSASSAYRWIRCPGSVKAQEKYNDIPSSYAIEGTKAHELAEDCLSTNNNTNFFKKKYSDIEMLKFVQEYLDYVRSFKVKNCLCLVETHVDFSNYIPEGRGTLDYAIISNGYCHIFDLKYGKGNKISPIENEQQKLYALGIYNKYGVKYNIKTFTLHIAQPRLYNYECWNISSKKIVDFGVYAGKQAYKTLKPYPYKKAGKIQCCFCKASGSCKTLANYLNKETLGMIQEGIHIEKNVLTLLQKETILKNKYLIQAFMKALENDIYQDLLRGMSSKNFKIVKKQSRRKWTEQGFKKLHEELGNKAFKKMPIGIVEAISLIGEKQIQQYCETPIQKKYLVSIDNNKEPVDIVNENIAMYFNEC